MRFNTRLKLLVIVLTIVLVAGYKLIQEPFMFDPTFGVSSLYDFDYYDPQNPLTVFYVEKGAGFVSATGDYHLVRDAVNVGGDSQTSIEWSFNFEKYLDILERVDGELNEMVILVASPHPLSSHKGTHVNVYINDRIVSEIELTVYDQGNYTWNLPLLWDIPGSNYAFVRYFSQIELPVDSELFLHADLRSTRVRISTDASVTWSIEYIVARLFSNFTKLGSPWWKQSYNPFLLVLPPLLSPLFLALFIRKKHIYALAKHIRTDGLVFITITAGIWIRLVTVPLMDFSNSFDLAVYRNVDMVTYMYGLDSRPLINMYGPIWHALLLFFYPAYLFLVPIGWDPYLENLVVKLPAILADLTIAYFLYHIGKAFDEGKNAKWLMAFWLLNPYAVYMSGIWGIYHVLPTMLAVVALDRLVNSKIKSSASALAGAIVSGIYRFLAFPIFLITLFKRDRGKAANFVLAFVMASALLVLPWAFSIAIFTNILQGPGRVGFPSLSYAFLFIPSHLWGYWTFITLLLTSGLLSVYVYKESKSCNRHDSSGVLVVNEFVLLSLLFFMLSSTLVFPTYVLGAIPHLLIAYFRTRKIPFAYIAFFMILPVLWLLYWPLLAFNVASGELFRDAFGLNFSIVSIMIVIKLFSREPDNKSTFVVPKLRLRDLSLQAWIKAALLSLMVVFVLAPWLQSLAWLDLWNKVLSIPVFLICLALIAASYTSCAMKGRVDSKGPWVTFHSLPNAQRFPILILTTAWLGSLVTLLFGVSSSGVVNYDQFLLPVVMVTWLPLEIRQLWKMGENPSSTTLIAFVQITYAITRYYGPLAGNSIIPSVSLGLAAVSVVLLFLAIHFRSNPKKQSLVLQGEHFLSTPKTQIKLYNDCR